MKACKTNAPLLPVMFSVCWGLCFGVGGMWAGTGWRVSLLHLAGCRLGPNPLCPLSPFLSLTARLPFTAARGLICFGFIRFSALVLASWLREGPQGPLCLAVGHPRAGHALGLLHLPARSTALVVALHLPYEPSCPC